MAGPDKVTKQDTPAPKKTDVDAISGATPVATNEQKAQAADLSRILPTIPKPWRDLAGALVPQGDSIVAVGGQPLLPPKAKGPKVIDFGVKAYNEFAKGTGGWENLARFLNLWPDYSEYFLALLESQRSSDADGPKMKMIKDTITWYCGDGELSVAVTHLGGLFAAISPTGKRWMSQDPLFLSELQNYCPQQSWMDAYTKKIRDNYYDNDGAVKAGEARRAASFALLKLLKTGAGDPLAAGGDKKKDQLSDEERTKREQEFTAKKEAIKKAISGTPKDHKLTNAEMTNLQVLLGTCPDWLKDRLYADSELQHYLVGQLSASQLKQVTASLDPIERLYQSCVNAKDAKERVELLKTYLKQFPGDGGMDSRQRVMRHTRLLNEYISPLGTDDYNLITRLICTGSDLPGPVEQLHLACDKNQVEEACHIILKYGTTDEFKAASADFLLAEKVRKINKEVQVDGLPMKPYELLQRAFGRNPYMSENPNGSQEQWVNPSAAPEMNLPLNQKDLKKLQNELFDPVVPKLCSELSCDADTFGWVTDDVVNAQINKFNDARSKPDNVALLLRAPYKAGEELYTQCNAKTGGKARKWLHGGCDEWLVQKVERAWGLLPDEAGRGTLEGKTQRTAENVQAGQEKVSVEQALKMFKIYGTIATDWIHGQASKFNAELNEEDEWFNSADVSDLKTIWDNFKAGMNAGVEPDYKVSAIQRIRDLTKRSHIEPIELFGNAFRQKAGDLEGKMRSKLGPGRLAIIIPYMGLTAEAIAARALQVEQDNAAVTAVVDLQKYGVKAKELFTKLTKLNLQSSDGDLRSAGDLLAECMTLKPLALSAESHGVEGAKYGVKGQVGGPVAPNAAVGSPRTFPDLYRRDFGIDADRHALEIARSLVKGGKDIGTVATALKIKDPGQITAEAKAPAEKLEMSEESRLLVSTGFTLETAKERAAEIWKVLHTTGQMQHLRKIMDGDLNGSGVNPEEHRLIHVAFRQLSGGIDLTFYVQQALAQFEDRKKVEMDRAVNHGSSSKPMPMQVGGAGTAEGKEAAGGKTEIDVKGNKGNMYETLGILQNGTVDIKSRLRSILYSDDVNNLYRVLEDATEAEKDAVYKDGELMHRIKALCDDQWEWNRVNKTLLGAADLADMLFARSHGDQGFWESTFGGTDEEGMKEDIKRYFKTRRRVITDSLMAGVPEPMRAARQKEIEPQIQAKLREESAKVAANPTVRAIIESELSGSDLDEIRGMAANGGEVKADAYLTADSSGFWYDKEKLIEKIRAMPVKEREEARKNPEFMRKLNSFLVTPQQKRDAMNALFNDTKTSDDDNLSKLDKESRGFKEVGQGTYDPNNGRGPTGDSLKVVEALAHMSEDEYRKLQANPTLRAQILGSLSGERLELAEKILAFHMAEPPSKADDTPQPGQPSKAEQQRIAYLKHNSIARVLYACQERGFDILARETVEIYQADFKPKLAAPVTTSDAPVTTDTTVKSDKPAPKPVDQSEVMSTKYRQEVWDAVASTVKDYSKIGEGRIGGKNLNQGELVAAIHDGIMHKQDPTRLRIAENTSSHNDNEEGLESAMNNASPELLCDTWATVKGKEPGGQPNLERTYKIYKDAREAAKQADLADASAGAGGAAPPDPKIARERKFDVNLKRRSFAEYIIDTSSQFEADFLHLAGDEDDRRTRQGEKRRVLENREWTKWQNIIRKKIKDIPVDMIAGRIGAAGDDDAMKILNDPAARKNLSDLRWGMEGHDLQRGYGANYNMDQATAGMEGNNLDTAAHRWKYAVGTSMQGDLVYDKDGKLDIDKSFATKGVITEAEQEDISTKKQEYEEAEAKFKEAKAKVAFWAALIVSVLITLLVTVLTAGMATGPMAVILLGMVTGAAAATGSALVNEAILGVDYEKKDALKEIATGAVTGALSAAGELVGSAGIKFLAKGLGGPTKAAAAAGVKEVGKQALWKRVLSEAGEEVLSTQFEGLVTAGAEFIDPTNWIKGTREGWIEGSSRAKAKLDEIPADSWKAALTAAVNTTVHAPFGGSKSEVVKGNKGAWSRVAGEIGVKTISEATVELLVELVTDPATYGEGLDGKVVAAKFVQSVLEEMKEAGISIHMEDAAHHKTSRHIVRQMETAAGKSLSKTERHLFMEAHKEHEVTMTVSEFLAIRNNAVITEVKKYSEKTKTELSPAALEAFVKWVREAPDGKEFQQRLKTDPMSRPEVKKAQDASAAIQQQVAQQQKILNNEQARQEEAKNPEGPAHTAIEAAKKMTPQIDLQVAAANAHAKEAGKLEIDASVALTLVKGPYRDAAKAYRDQIKSQVEGAKGNAGIANDAKEALNLAIAGLNAALQASEKVPATASDHDKATAKAAIVDALAKVRAAMTKALVASADAESAALNAKLAAQELFDKIQALADMSHDAKPDAKKDETTDKKDEKKKDVATDDKKDATTTTPPVVDTKTTTDDQKKTATTTPDEKHTVAMELFGPQLGPDFAKDWNNKEQKGNIVRIEQLMGRLDEINAEKEPTVAQAQERTRIEAELDALIATLGLDPKNRKATEDKLLGLMTAGPRAEALAWRLNNRVLHGIEVRADGKSIVVVIGGKTMNLDGLSPEDATLARWMAMELQAHPAFQAWLRGEQIPAEFMAKWSKPGDKTEDNPLFQPAPDFAQALIAWLEAKKRVQREAVEGKDAKGKDVKGEINKGNAVDLSKFSPQAIAKINFLVRGGGMNLYEASADASATAEKHHILDKIDVVMAEHVGDKDTPLRKLAEEVAKKVEPEYKPGETKLSVEQILRYLEIRQGKVDVHAKVQEQIESGIEEGAVDRVLSHAQAAAKAAGIDGTVEVFVTGGASKIKTKDGKQVPLSFTPGDDLDMIVVVKTKDGTPPTQAQLAALEQAFGSFKVNGRLPAELSKPGQRFTPISVDIKAMTEAQFFGWGSYEVQVRKDGKDAEGKDTLKAFEPLMHHKLDPSKPKDTKTDEHKPVLPKAAEIGPVAAGDDRRAEEVVKKLGGWENVKSVFAKDDPASMQALVDFRKRWVDYMLAEIATKHGLSMESMGSTNLESDYDLSMEGDPKAAADKKKQIAKAIGEFNTLFRSLFGMEAGSFFDTNLYDKGEALAGRVQEGQAAKGGPKPTIPVLMTEGGKKANERIQDVAALIKVRKYMGDQQKWDDWTKAQLDMISDKAAQLEFKQRLAEADREFKAVEDAKARKLAELDPKGEKKGDKDLELRASNQLYAESLREVDKLREQRAEALKLLAEDPDNEQRKAAVDAFTVKMKEAMRFALNFANEAYNSEGALLDVVGNEQGNRKGDSKARGWDLALTDGERLQSLNEQFGDALKDLGHYEGQFEKGAVKVSKYVARFIKMVHAIQQSKGISAAEMAPIAHLLRQLEAFNATLLDVRKGAKKAGKKADQIDVKALLAAHGITNLEKYREILEGIALHMNMLARMPRPDAKPTPAVGDDGGGPDITDDGDKTKDQDKDKDKGTDPHDPKAPHDDPTVPGGPEIVQAGDWAAAERIIKKLGSWEEVKSVYAKDYPITMQRLVDFRKMWVDRLLTEVCATYGLSKESMGSTGLTSDYDLSLEGDPKAAAGKSKEISLAIHEFNDRFRKFFGMEAGVFFDTNLYDKGEALAGSIQEGAHERGGAAPTVPVLLTDKGKKDNERIQDVAALIKMRKYIGGEQQWKDWSEAQLALITDKDARLELKQRLKEADQEYQRVQEAMAEKLKALEPDEKKREKKLQDPNFQLTASNELYAEALIEVDHLRGQREQAIEALKRDPEDPKLQAAVDALTVKMKEKMRFALNFANEAYNSEGALLDVVGNEQGNRAGDKKARGWDIKLTDGERLQSLNEQFGDSLKDLAHAHGDLEGGAVKVSKYIGRFLKMVHAIQAAKGISAGEMEKISGLIASLEAINSTLFGMRKKPDTFDKAKVHELLAGVGIGSLERYREILEQITLHMNMLARMPRPDSQVKVKGDVTVPDVDGGPEPTLDGAAGKLANTNFHGQHDRKGEVDDKTVETAIWRQLALILPSGAVVRDKIIFLRDANGKEVMVTITVDNSKDGEVARFERNGAGGYTIFVSKKALDEHVPRALAHEFAEIQFLIDNKMTDQAHDESKQQEQPGAMTAHYAGRLAELKLLFADLDRAKSMGGDASEIEKVDRLTREINELLRAIGLEPGAPGREVRLAEMVAKHDAKLRQRIALHSDAKLDRPTVFKGTTQEKNKHDSEEHLKKLAAATKGSEHSADLVAAEKMALAGQMAQEESLRVFDQLNDLMDAPSVVDMLSTLSEKKKAGDEQAKTTLAEFSKLQKALLAVINNPNLNQKQKREAMAGILKTAREAGKLGPLQTLINWDKLAQAAGKYQETPGLMTMNLSTGKVAGGPKPDLDMRGLLHLVDEANKGARENGLQIEYVVVVENPVKDDDGIEHSIVRVVARPVPQTRLPDAKGQLGDKSGQLPSMPPGTQGDLTVDVGVGRGNFAAEMVSADDRAKGLIVQTEHSSMSDIAMRVRGKGFANPAPIQIDGSVLVIADFLKHPKFLAAFAGGSGPQPGVMRIFLNNVSAHFKDGDYEQVAKALSEIMGEGGQIEIQWTDTPEDAEGNSRGHIDGKKLAAALEAAGIREVTPAHGAAKGDDFNWTIDSGASNTTDKDKFDKFSSPVPKYRTVIKFGGFKKKKDKVKDDPSLDAKTDTKGKE
jgi:hypothetical protein